MTRTFIGLGDYAGWRFTLEPSNSGRPGFIRRQLSPSHANVEALQHINPLNESISPGYTAKMRELVMNPPPVWMEEQWLTEWLRRKVTLQGNGGRQYYLSRKALGASSKNGPA